MPHPSDRLRPIDAATLLGNTVSTLARKRCQGNGCAYLKINGCVYYLRADIDAYVARHTTYHQTAEATK